MIVDKATLKSYFNTTDKPTEDQFANLIDTIFSLNPLVAEQQLVAPASNLVFSGLDGLADGGYRLEIMGGLTATDTLSWSANGDAVATHYLSQGFQHTGSLV